jgi:hypothetical protein
MKTIKINQSEIQTWHTPPENQGQIVTVSYASAGDVALEKIYDASDRSCEIYVYRHAVRGEWDPWNGTPKMGKKLGVAEIIDDESE